MQYREVITDAVDQTLRDLHRVGALENSYLAGCTGMALRFGHRRSIDLDFFSNKPFDPDSIVSKIESLGGLSVLAKDLETLHLTVGETRVSFLGYHDPLLFPSGAFQEVSVADPREIACVKISAIAGRGTKRDFVDLYTVAQLYGLGQLLAWFNTKCASANYSAVYLLKSLTYFEQAEKDPMPDMLINLSWEQVKQFFTVAVPPLL